MKPQPMGKLLVSPNYWWSVRDHDHEWITDRYSVVRADLLSTRVRSTAAPGAITNKVIRDTLAWGRDVSARLPGGEPVQTDVTSTNKFSHDPAVLLRCGGLCLLMNNRTWKAWKATGCTAHVTRRGLVVWTAQVRGREALMGLSMPVYPQRGNTWSTS
jgi:hypothetical protein